MSGESIEVKTSYNMELIKQSEVFHSDFRPSLMREMTERIISLRDQGVKDALKAIGWLSPEEAKALKDEIAMLRAGK